MRLKFWQKALPDADPERLGILQEQVRTAEMLEAWQKMPSYRWLMDEGRSLQESFIEQNNAQGANGILQLTKSVERTINLKRTALAEFSELQEEQRNASQSLSEPDTAPETRKAPQIT